MPQSCFLEEPESEDLRCFNIQALSSTEPFFCIFRSKDDKNTEMSGKVGTNHILRKQKLREKRNISRAHTGGGNPAFIIYTMKRSADHSSKIYVILLLVIRVDFSPMVLYIYIYVYI